ncbi:hypothetical protein AMTRI_Chr09g12240 [Amborella trichopoda]
MASVCWSCAAPVLWAGERTLSLIPSSSSSSTTTTTTSCGVAGPLLHQDLRRRLRPLFSSSSSHRTTTTAATLTDDEVVLEDEEKKKMIGAKVRVKVPVKVYHVPKIPDLDLLGMEGEITDYVALWKGNRISANLPYKVQFALSPSQQQEQGGISKPIKFFAHLREDEFDCIAAK